MKRGAKIAGVVVAVAGLLALLSYYTTTTFRDGGFPSGEFRVNVQNPEGKPIKGAVLRVYRGGTSELATGYPLDTHVSGQELISDDSGRITAIRKEGGLQFGGRAWRLFWMFPMGAKAPEYDCEITGEGFRSLKFPVWQLFASPHRYYEEFPKTKLEVDGKELEVKIYEHTFTLER
jgi:hypothetical protein